MFDVFTVWGALSYFAVGFLFGAGFAVARKIVSRLLD